MRIPKVTQSFCWPFVVDGGALDFSVLGSVSPKSSNVLLMNHDLVKKVCERKANNRGGICRRDRLTFPLKNIC
jgi:hypothetical protein